MALIECSECGNQVSDKAAACPKCGAPIAGETVGKQQSIAAAAPKSRSLAIVLALFLGGLGIHKFYINQPVLGFLYLIFCWTFIPALLGLFESIAWMSYSDEFFQRQYVTKD
jgi:TM2 domain-containing membrane protein YozV